MCEKDRPQTDTKRLAERILCYLHSSCLVFCFVLSPIRPHSRLVDMGRGWASAGKSLWLQQNLFQCRYKLWMNQLQTLHAACSTVIIFFFCSSMCSLNWGVIVVVIYWLNDVIFVIKGGWWTLSTCSICHLYQPSKPSKHDSENQTTDLTTTPQRVLILLFRIILVITIRILMLMLMLLMLAVCIPVSRLSQTDWESGSAGSAWLTMRLCTMTRINYGKHVRTHTHTPYNIGSKRKQQMLN